MARRGLASSENHKVPKSGGTGHPKQSGQEDKPEIEEERAEIETDRSSERYVSKIEIAMRPEKESEKSCTHDRSKEDPGVNPRALKEEDRPKKQVD